MTINLPELGEGVDSVDVVAILVSVGDRIEEEQGLIEVETEKASVEVPSTAAGTITEIHVAVGDVLSENAPIVALDAAKDKADAAPGEIVPEPESAHVPATKAEPPPIVESAPPPPSATPRDGKKSIPAAPTARRFAREVGVDISTVSGTGPGGRISIDDVKAEANRLLTDTDAGPGSAATIELPDLERFGPVHREPMTKIRKLTAENLSRAWVTVPQVTNHEIADITDLEEFRKAFKERVEAAGGKLTMTALLVKIVATALKAHPVLNAAVDMARQEIVFRYSINIGVAVDTDRGLLVPVIRDADGKNLTEISVELDDLAKRARSKKLKPDEMQGGTFSISNLGGIGGTGFSPIVNWPEVAILGVSRGSIQPQWHEGSFRPRLMMPLSLSYDHRLVDGADAARFLARLKDALEQQMLLVLDG
ncbi:MAG: 2-oxo acid dehydrogenase subunit E2 [Acidobacteria bacterium]|nr:2-oxo acid dehydrogenase subunit E2 [Candidatus Sulfomarinibacter sp. MAG AM1]